MARTRRLVMRLCTVAVVLSVAACGAGGEGAGDTASVGSSSTAASSSSAVTVSVSVASTPAPPTSPPLPPPTSATTLPPPTPPATSSTTAPGMTTVALNGFVSPSGNIACAMSAASARCDLQTRTWSLPPRPANCEFDWGGSLKVTGQGPGFLACVSDSPFGVTAVLAYGTRSTIGPMTCTSAETGMTCVNTATGHGFSVSRDDYRLF